MRRLDSVLHRPYVLDADLRRYEAAGPNQDALRGLCAARRAAHNALTVVAVGPSVEAACQHAIAEGTWASRWHAMSASRTRAFHNKSPPMLPHAISTPVPLTDTISAG